MYGDFILITSMLILFDSLADMGTRIIGVRRHRGKRERKEKERSG